MTAATYPATNLQLTYDNDTDKWSFTEVAYNYPTGQTPSWQGYTTPDTPFPTGDTDGADIPPAEDEDRDPLFREAAVLLVIHQQGSTSMIQRKLKLGYNRAGRIIDQLEAAGILGPLEGSKGRKVLIETEEELNQII